MPLKMLPLPRQLVVIDDVEPAMRLLLPKGREILRPIVDRIYSVATHELSKSGCILVRHDAFAHWVRGQVDPSVMWFVLDPLVQAESLGAECASWRMSRVMKDGRWDYETDEAVACYDVFGRDCGLIDDGAYTGRTLRTALGVMKRQGGIADDILVCAGSAKARDSVRSAFPDVGWAQQVPGDSDVLHLRDICPFVPLSGRRVVDKPAIEVPGGHVEVRVPVDGFADCLWRTILQRPHLRDAVTWARRELAVRLSTAIGREALVGDLVLLGPGVPLPLYRPQHASQTSALRYLA